MGEKVEVIIYKCGDCGAEGVYWDEDDISVRCFCCASTNWTEVRRELVDDD